MKHAIKTLLVSLSIFALLASAQIYAETKYIDDTLRIPLRSGATSQHRIVNFLNSGTQVELINLSEEDEGWGFVRLNSGKEGWLQVRYLRNTPAAKQQLKQSQQALAKAKTTIKEQKATISELKSELKAVKKELSDLSKHSGSADKELAHIKEISKNAIRLDHSNNQLIEENELLKASNEDALQQLTKLESNQQNRGMVYGALAVLLGIILGWIMPKMKTRQNDGWV